tara:strand:- start:7055 stop:7402 length:348 start_codon:yes stop_codon:yes gene_type:complete
MKNLIREDILLTKLKDPQNFKHIQLLQNIVDLESISLSTFLKARQKFNVEDFVNRYASIDLHKKCTDVFYYLGGHYLQVLSDGKYLLQYSKDNRGKRSADLNQMEELIYKIVSNV